MNDNLIMYLSNEREPSPDGGGSPFFCCFRENVDDKSCEYKNMYTITKKIIDC
ncbi:hypothetical protein [Clostridium sp.]|uniref:hypothetical protein n=1 Tax=Clostridium sp. TaxID=1506 RepID=UPI00261E29E8|nr:hypothetical protein [Clostridium sp.]